MNLSPQKQIEQNLILCENLIDILNLLENSDITEPNIFIKIEEIQADALKMKAKVEQLKDLYGQVII